MLKETVFVFAVLIVFADVTVVYHCNSDIPLEGTTQISISGCDKPTCLLKQGTSVTVEIKLVSKFKDIQSLTNNVIGIISRNVSVLLDRTDACDNIYNVDGSKSGCPLKKGVKYVYKKSYFILPLYPTISVVVRYALRRGSDKVCFEVPLKITK